MLKIELSLECQKVIYTLSNKLLNLFAPQPPPTILERGRIFFLRAGAAKKCPIYLRQRCVLYIQHTRKDRSCKKHNFLLDLETQRRTKRGHKCHSFLEPLTLIPPWSLVLDGATKKLGMECDLTHLPWKYDLR